MLFRDADFHIPRQKADAFAYRSVICRLSVLILVFFNKVLKIVLFSKCFLYNSVQNFLDLFIFVGYSITMNTEKSTSQYLQKRIMEQFGRHIVSLRDCEELASVLERQFNAQISAQTLRRFFGIVKSDSNPSVFTLNLLANYCGFRDYESFRISYKNSDLELFFGDVLDERKDYWRKSEELCAKISSSAEMLITTHHRLMSFPMARKFFMEHHPMRDMLGSVYTQYFLAYLKFNTSSEAKIFAYGFLFKSAFLQQNLELLELYYKKVKEVELTKEIHVIPVALKYGTILLYANFTKNEYLFRKTFKEMITSREAYISASQKSVCSFEYTVLESLIFTNRKKEIRFLLENHVSQTEDDQYFVPQDRKNTHEEVWKILQAVSFQKLGHEAESKRLLNSIDLDKLGIGWKNYYSIFYKFLELDFSEGRKKEKCITDLQKLIDKTYFFYFQEQLNAQLPLFIKN